MRLTRVVSRDFGKTPCRELFAGRGNRRGYNLPTSHHRKTLGEDMRSFGGSSIPNSQNPSDAPLLPLSLPGPVQLSGGTVMRDPLPEPNAVHGGRTRSGFHPVGCGPFPRSPSRTGLCVSHRVHHDRLPAAGGGGNMDVGLSPPPSPLTTFAAYLIRLSNKPNR